MIVNRLTSDLGLAIDIYHPNAAPHLPYTRRQDQSDSKPIHSHSPKTDDEVGMTRYLTVGCLKLAILSL
jgi:hypothetical protein